MLICVLNTNFTWLQIECLENKNNQRLNKNNTSHLILVIKDKSRLQYLNIGVQTFQSIGFLKLSSKYVLHSEKHFVSKNFLPSVAFGDGWTSLIIRFESASIKGE